MARSKQRLTNGRVNRQKHQPGASNVAWCSETRGFGVRILESGTQSYVLKYRTPEGRSRMITIGQVGDFAGGVEEARERVQRAKVGLMDGVDPLEERQTRRYGSKGAPFTEIAEAFLAEHATRPSAASDRQRYRVWLKPAFGSRSALEIRRSEVAQLYRTLVAERSCSTANRLLSLLSSMFGWAVAMGKLPEDFDNPALRLGRRVRIGEKSRRRSRYLSEAEGRRLLARLSQHENPWFRGFTVFALATGMRKGELLAAVWSDVDFDAKSLHIPKTKTGVARRVPLSRAAMLALQALPREGERLFPGRSRGRALAPDHLWARLRADAEISGLTFHDLRRTHATWAGQLGANPKAISDNLGHSLSGMTLGVYVHASWELQVDAAERVGSRILELAGYASVNTVA